jgi:hypothetical protein
MKTTIITALIAASLAADARADWFARLDNSNQLVITGVATEDSGILSTITLTCDKGRFKAEVLTLQNATKEDLPNYEGVKVIFAYKTRQGDKLKMGLDGEPVLLLGNGLGIVSNLTEEQSKALYTSIVRGNRLDMELVHPDLDPDITTTPKKIYSGGFTQFALAMSEHCPGFE